MKIFLHHQRGRSSVVERMLRMYEVLGSIPSVSNYFTLYNKITHTGYTVVSLRAELCIPSILFSATLLVHFL